MVWLNEQLGGIGKRLVLCEPCGLGVPMGAVNWQVADMRIELPGNLAGTCFGREQPVFMNQHVFYSSLSERIDPASASIPHAREDSAHISKGLNDAWHRIVAVDFVFE